MTEEGGRAGQGAESAVARGDGDPESFVPTLPVGTVLSPRTPPLVHGPSSSASHI